MSIKIYQAFRLKNHNLEQTLEKFKQITRSIKNEADHQYRKILFNLAASIYDDLVFNLQEEKNDNQFSPCFNAEIIISNRQKKIKMENTHDPLCDYQVEVVVFPCGQHTLFIPFVPHNDILASLVKELSAEEYGYWDNVDQPESVSSELWEQRKLDWQSTGVFDHKPIISMGFSFTFCSNKHYFDRYSVNINDYLPDYNSRVERIARQLLKKEIRGSVFDFIKTEAGHLLFEQKKDEIRLKLKEQLTRADLI